MSLSFKNIDVQATAYLLMVIALPLTIVGAVQTSARVLTPAPEEVVQTRDPEVRKNLFDLQQFIELRRAIRQDQVPADHDAAPVTVDAPVVESIPAFDFFLINSGTPGLSVPDLTPEQQKVLHTQVSNHICPQDADSYTILCNKLLAEHEAVDLRAGFTFMNQ